MLVREKSMEFATPLTISSNRADYLAFPLSPFLKQPARRFFPFMSRRIP
jgi:hypothetical protein